MIGKDIYTIDNVIPTYKQNQLEDLFISSKLSWMFFQDCVTADSDIDKSGNKPYTPGIGIYIASKEPYYLNESLLDETKIIPQSACKAIEKECVEIFNTRAFMHFPLRDDLKMEYDNPHIDARYPHLVCLYYLNDSDGDTFIFDKTINDTPKTNSNTKFEIIKRITPKKGRAILFDGNRYHSSSGPTKGVRCILNFNVLIK
jgi:hypothetical protein